jgi:hypothetical protein
VEILVQGFEAALTRYQEFLGDLKIRTESL